MTLKLTAEPTFVAKVPIPIPGQEPKKVEFTFKHRTKDELDALFKRNLEDVPYTMEIVLGWGLADAFTPENVALFYQHYHGAARAISLAYVSELQGARLGN